MSVFCFQILYTAGYTRSSSRNDVTNPPIIGAAMRFITSAPAPVDHMIGRSPMKAAITVIIFGRTRFTAPCTMASSRSSELRRCPRFFASP